MEIPSRGYQMELFERSKHQNIIVTLGTGLGKTQIAVLRLRYEVRRQPHKATLLSSNRLGEPITEHINSI
jgi:ERCC4-related helicase